MTIHNLKPIKDIRAAEEPYRGRKFGIITWLFVAFCVFMMGIIFTLAGLSS